MKHVETNISGQMHTALSYTNDMISKLKSGFKTIAVEMEKSRKEEEKK